MIARFAGHDVDPVDVVGDHIAIAVRPFWLHAMLKVDTLGRLELPGEEPCVAEVLGAPTPGAACTLHVLKGFLVPEPAQVELLPHALCFAALEKNAPVLTVETREALDASFGDLAASLFTVEAAVQVPTGARHLRSTATHLLGRLATFRCAEVTPSAADEAWLVTRARELVDLARTLSRHLGV